MGLTSGWLFLGLDVSVNGPDEQSIITYVSQFLEHFPGLEEVGSPPRSPGASQSARNVSVLRGSSPPWFLRQKNRDRSSGEACLCAGSTSATVTPTTGGTASTAAE